MTCIVGLINNGSVYIGGDSAGVGGGYRITLRDDPKVFQNGKFLIGFTSSFRMGQLLMHAFKPPEQKKNQTDYNFMVTTFVDAVRKCFKDGGWLEIDKGEETGGSFVIGYKSNLYYMESDLQIGIPSVGYYSVGCGSDLALGAMYACNDLDPIFKIKTALKAAETFSAGVSAPFIIKQLK